MKKLKVVTVVGTRPEIIRLSRIITALNKSDAIEHLLVHTGQNYDFELNEIFFQDLGLEKPDYYLNAAGENACQTIGTIIISIDSLLNELNPDALLVLGDTNSCLSAIPAKKRKIPIFHLEAGNRCFDQRVPEETNRKIVDHISDINLTYSDIARQYLLREGISPDRVIKVGSPMFEVLHFYRDKIERSKVLEVLKLHNGNYFLVSAHREENISSKVEFADFVETINKMAHNYGLPIIISTHPRTRKMIEQKEIKFHPLVQLLKPFSFSDYVKLQMSAKVVLSDSGTISEESSILNFPALNIRNAHERPEAMEEAAVMMVGLKQDRIMQGLVQLNQEELNQDSDHRIVSDYSMPNISDKVVRIIISYTDFINQKVWFKGV